MIYYAYSTGIYRVHSRIFLSDLWSRADIVRVAMDVSCMTNCCNTPAKHHQQPRRAVNARPDLCRSLRDSQIQPLRFARTSWRVPPSLIFTYNSDNYI